MHDLRIINGLVYIDDTFTKVNIYIKDGIISNISNELLEAFDTYDAQGSQVIPGIIDPHTHFDLDLGFTKSKDDFYTGTKAAAFGGVTTIIDFLDPINKATDLENAFLKRVLEASTSVIDYKFHACLKNPENEVSNIVKELPKYGLNTVKIFTTYSDSNRRTYDKEIKELLTLSSTNNFTLTVHVEKDDLIVTNKEDSYKKLPLNRPTVSETLEALHLAELVKETNGTLYMVHLSSGETLQQLKEKHSDILNKHFIIESCPHYFTFNNEVLNQEDGYLYTMAPPLRSEEETILLNNLVDDVYTVGTDHCSFNKEEKENKLLHEMPLGIAGVEESFRVMYTKYGKDIIPKMTSNVAKAHKLYPQKGVIQIGSDADLFIYKLKDTSITETHNNTNYNLYQNYNVNGEVISTLSKGNFVVKDKTFRNNHGKLLNKGGTYESN